MNLFKKKKQEPFNPNKNNGTKPIRLRIAVGDINDKFSEYPSNGLNPKRLAQIFKEADAGNVRRQMELFEEIEEKDTHLFSQLQTRKLAVTGLDWEIQSFSKEEKDLQIASFVEEQVKGFDNFNDILLDMLDAIGKGISISEINWGVSKAGQNIIESIEWVHPKKLIWDSLTDEMLICTKEFPAGIQIPKNKFVIHKYKAKSGHDSRSGILRIVAWMYLFKNFTIKDWVSFCEVFGMPLRLGTYDVSASEDDKKALMEAIYSLGTDAAGIIPSSTDIKFIESQKTTSVEIYEKFARYADEQMSKAIVGQTLTADSGGGSYAQGKVHGEVKHDITVADAKSLATSIRNYIIRPLVEYNYGSDTNIPIFAFDCQEADDLKETVEIYKTLSCDMGLKIPVSHIRKKFSIPEPKDGEEVINPVKDMPGSNMPRQPELELKLKNDGGSTEQAQIDNMAALVTTKSSEIFTEMLKPILNLIDNCTTLEEIQAALSDDQKLKEVYGEMNTGELQDVVNQGMYLANLVGRTME